VGGGGALLAAAPVGSERKKVKTAKNIAKMMAITFIGGSAKAN
jgi:hypothetical protein